MTAQGKEIDLANCDRNYSEVLKQPPDWTVQSLVKRLR